MLLSRSVKSAWAISTLVFSFMPPAASGACPVFVHRFVEFDFAQSAECHDVTPPERTEQNPNQRLIELTLPVSIRFRGVRADNVEELDIEINGATTDLHVYSFSPSTQLASDLSKEIESTTTTKKEHSFGATLGGALPVPHANVVAQVSPSINANTSSCETVTEKLNRLPPKYAVVVSGTSSDGHGVFFKLKRSSQRSLEGMHELTIVFIAPAEWQRGEVDVICSARGSRRVLWIKQPTTFSRAVGTVQLEIAGAASARRGAQGTAEAVPADNVWR
jgi:hypothetical protein